MDSTAREVSEGTAVADESKKSTDEIRRDIERTRVELTSTVDAIQERLRPAAVRARARAAAQERLTDVGQRAGSALAQVAHRTKREAERVGQRVDPSWMAGAVAAIGFVWTVINVRRSRSHRHWERNWYRWERKPGPTRPGTWAGLLTGCGLAWYAINELVRSGERPAAAIAIRPEAGERIYSTRAPEVVYPTGEPSRVYPSGT